MRFGHILGSIAGLSLVTLAGLASAEEAPPAAATSDGHASGLMVQARLQAQGGLLSVGGGPSFLLGYQGSGFALGLGLGLTRVGVSAGSEASGSLTLFQVMPTALVDVWHSKDGRARANVIGGLGYGRGSLEVNGNSQTCAANATGGSTCTTNQETASASVGFIPVMLGFGGDYFLSRNFALGAEAGLQGAFTVGLDDTSNGSSSSVAGSANMQLAYGALRATFVLGD